MEQQTVHDIINATRGPRKAATYALGMLAVFLLVGTMSELKGLRFIGSGVAATNTITVTGEGEVFAVPDTATFSVSVRETAKEVKSAQDVATKKGNDIIAYLKGAGIDEKDIKTIDYNISPQYEWSRMVCPQGSYCPDGRQVLTGFQVSQTLSVKVRDTKKAGDLLAGVGSRGASDVSSLNFTIDDEDALNVEARNKAIAEAKKKADELARSLGVSIVRVVGFSENGGGYPIYYAKGMGGAMDSAVAQAAPQVPVGENKIISNVSVTYEIR